MKLLVSGASGLVGSAACQHLREQGHEVSCLVRNRESMKSDDVFWNPTRQELNPQDLEGFDGVIHLAGENIANERWTAEKKNRISRSRVDGTSLLAKALSSLTNKPKVFICASAIGFYGNRGDEVLTEDSPAGEGFLPEVCAAWEKATEPASRAGIRTVNLRIGIVLTPKGGALKRMLLPFRLGLGGKVGNGNQYMSWISLNDLTRIIDFSLTHASLRGPVNAVSPQPLTNAQFTKFLGHSLKRPTLLPLPAFATKLFFGEMAEPLLLASAKVKAKQLRLHNFVYLDDDLINYICSCLGKT